MKKFSHTLETTVSAEAIWALWTSVERWPDWDSELKAAQLEDDFCLGAVGQLTPRSGPTSKFEISALDWGQSYTFTTQLPLCRLNVRRYFEPGDVLRFTHEVSFEGPLSFVFSRVLGARFQKVLPGVMRSLSQMAEQQMLEPKG